MKKFLGKHRILLGVELLLIILCGILSFLPEKIVFSTDAGDIASRMDVDGYSGYYRSDEIVLSPGVYRLRAHGGDHEGTWYFTVSSGESTYQALRCNETSISAHRREVDMEVYVVDKVDTAFVSYKYIGETGQPIEKISLYHTGAGWRMLAFILLLVAIAVNLLVWLRESGVKKEQQMVVWGLGLCVLLAYLPYTTDYFSYGDDLQFHLRRIEGLKETLLHGQPFPVRVQEYWLYGHSFTVTGFCGDLFLLFPAVLRIIGFSLMDAYKLFVLAVLVGTAGIAYYAFYRCSGNHYSAMLGSVLYELAPYHIYSVYNQSAVGEYLGMMFLPLVLCGIYRIYTGSGKEPDYVKAKIPLIAGVIGILYAHILMGMAVVVVLLLVAAVMWRKTFQKETLRELVTAALGCLLGGVWIWAVPLKICSVDFYELEELIGHNICPMGTGGAGILQIYPYVGGEQTGMYNCQPVQVGAAFWVVLLCYLLLRLGRRGQGKAHGESNSYDKVMGAGVVLGLLFSVCYPALAILFLAFTACFFVLWLWEEKKGWTALAGEAVTAGCFLAVGVVALWGALYQVDDISSHMSPTRLYTAESMVGYGTEVWEKTEEYSIGGNGAEQGDAYE